jgi:hypothetical protein
MNPPTDEIHRISGIQDIIHNGLFACISTFPCAFYSGKIVLWQHGSLASSMLRHEVRTLQQGRPGVLPQLRLYKYAYAVVRKSRRCGASRTPINIP